MKTAPGFRTVALTLAAGSCLLGVPVAAGAADSRPSLSLQAASAPADSLAVGLIAHWPLDDGRTTPGATTAAEVIGGANGRLTSPDPAGAWVGPEEARMGGALRVDGEGTFVDIPAAGTLDPGTNQVTLALWVKLDQLPSELPAGFGGIYDSPQDAYVLYLDRGAAELRFKVTDSAGHAARPGIPEDRLTLGEWRHVAAVYDGKASPQAGEARLYLQGELVDFHTGNDGAGGTGLTGIVRAGQIAALGRDGTEARYFLGAAIDDIALWRRALTEEEIAYLAAGNVVPTPPPPTDPLVIASSPQSTTALDGSYVTFRVTVSGGVPPISYQWRRGGSDLPGATSTQLAVIAGPATAGSYTVVARDSRGSVESTPAILTVTPLASEPAESLRQGLAALWPLDDGIRQSDTTDVVDVVNGNRGQLGSSNPAGAWLAGADARFGGALRFDGADTFVAVPPSVSLNFTADQVTVAAWIRLTDLPSALPEGFGGIFDSVQDNYVLYADRGNRELRFKVTDARGHAARPGISEDLLVVGEWMHIAGVYNGRATPTGGEAALYLNGELADSHVGNDGGGGSGLTGLVRTGQSAAIGRNGTENRYFLDARLDDLAVWHRALSPAEIAYLAAGHAVPPPAPDAPLRLETPVLQAGSLALSWSGGRPPYRVQRRASLAEGDTWQNVGALIDTTSLSVPVDAGAAFYRVVGDAGALP